MFLAEAKEGKKVKIKTILGGFRLKQRLADLSIYEGTTVEVIKNDLSGGPVLLKVLDSKIALGRGQVVKIKVETIK